MQTNPIFSPGKSLGERSLAGYSLSSHEELDMTENFKKYLESFGIPHAYRDKIINVVINICWATKKKSGAVL